jgi:hypothetical protein
VQRINVHDEALVKVERALSLWIEDMEHVPVDGHVIHEKVLILCEHFPIRKAVYVFRCVHVTIVAVEKQ